MPTIEELRKKRCQPCEDKGIPPMAEEPARRYLSGIPGWTLAQNGKAIQKLFVMKNFMAAVRFVNEVAELAEDEGHHPDLHLTGYRKLLIELATHAVGGLSENDFILASKIEALPKELKI